MEDVSGRSNNTADFETFLADWRAILDKRAEQAIAEISSIQGVHGLILAGSVGRNEQWPLSDIDLLPIVDDVEKNAVIAQIQHIRSALMADWMNGGWWTGLDVGSLFFTTRETESLLAGKTHRLTRLLKVPRWHHGIDKGYLGRAVFGPISLTDDLVSWINEHRFHPAITKLRRKWSWQQFQHALEQCSQQVNRGNTFEATVAIRASANALMSWQLESWNRRDASFGRIGTQFEHLALVRGEHDIVPTIRNLNDLHDPMIRKRMLVAPFWVLERHERSFRARRLVNEELGKSEDMRDTLRVCSVYESRKLLGTPPPYPGWLAIPDELSDVTVKMDEITEYLARYVAEPRN